jgi:hypothetical protein
LCGGLKLVSESEALNLDPITTPALVCSGRSLERGLRAGDMGVVEAVPAGHTMDGLGGAETRTLAAVAGNTVANVGGAVRFGLPQLEASTY